MGDKCVFVQRGYFLSVLLVFCVFVRFCATDKSSNHETAKKIQDANSICQMEGCNCTTEHKYWRIVNCTFDNKQIVEFKPGTIPVNAIEISIIGGGELRLQAQTFSTLKNFQRLRTDGAAHLIFKKYAFVNLTVNSLLVQVASCDSLMLESAAFKNMKGPVTLEVTRCSDVTIQQSAFGFLQNAVFTEIPRLELAEGAFIIDTRDLGPHGAVTTIRFKKVIIPVLPKDVFKSSLAEVSIIESEVRDVLGESFSGNTIAAVYITNSSLHRVRARAFSDRTQLDNLAITGSRIHILDTNCLLAAVANLSIQYSNITTMSTNAFSAIVARLLFRNNIVESIYPCGITVKDWSRVSIDYNVFGRLSDRAFDVSELHLQDWEREISFSDNVIHTIDAGSLFTIGQATISKAVQFSKIIGNKFGYTCHCDIKKWMEETIGENVSANVIADNYCSVDSILAQCYELVDSLILIKNFTDVYCDEGNTVINCKTFVADANVGITRPFGSLEDENDNSNLILGIVLGSVLILAVSGTIVILLIRGSLWLKRKGYCVRFKNFNNYHQNDDPSTEAEDIILPIDKSHENLPEELTQDLLQTLREKLEDPSTYNEAREMIERLYDHFIIEDSYTNNNRQQDDHLYEELGNLQLQQQSPEDFPPNLDKSPTNRPFDFLRLIEERFNLTPTTNNPSVLAPDYSEPTDAEVHLYSELPAQSSGKENRQNEINEVLTRTLTPPPPSSSNASTASGNRMAYRPLPPQPNSSDFIGLQTAICTTTTVLHDPGPGPSTKF